MAESTYLIIFVGNPLLDMQVMNGEKLLEKYDLKVNDAILAEEKHLAMYELFFLNPKLISCISQGTMNWLRSIK
jgi:hypothetical protein